MSSNSMKGTKLVVHIAENGHSYELDCEESMMVEAVQQFLESTSGIRINDQLLLCLHMKLESHIPLSAYELPSNDREVFLYNRARLLTESSLPPSEHVEIQEVVDPPSPSSSQNPHPLDDAPDPALKALPSYERQFRYHYQRGRAIYDSTQLKFKHCERLLREQKVQERALETARGSMDHYYRMITQMYTEFTKCYSVQHGFHSDLLANFKRDIEKLRSCKLHPALQTDSRKCLLDLVEDESLWNQVETCNISHRQFEAKVSQFNQMFNEIKRRVEDLFSTKAAAIKELELMIKEHQSYLNEQTSIMQSLSKDVNSVKKLVDDCLSCQLSASLRPHDAVSALGPMYDVHDKNHLPKMQACERSISKLLDFCNSKKNEMNLFVHTSMQKVAYVQSVIRDFRLRFPAFKEAMGHHDKLFSRMKLVRVVGSSYRACLAEVVRRKASMKLYMGMAGQLAERLATKRETEVRRREEFIKAQSIPRDILASMGLFDTPNQCDVNIAPFDTNLLEIDISDIDRYAPEHLVYMSFKSDKHGSSKGSFSMSNDGLGSQFAEENSMGTSEKHDYEFESVEIAGTSKMEVENARLKAELASAIVMMCSFNPEIEYESFNDNQLDSLLKNTAKKTAEALNFKDEYGKHLQSMLSQKQMQCLSYEKRIEELEQRLSEKLSGSKLGDGETHLPYMSTEPMDEVSCTSTSSDTKLQRLCRQSSKNREGVDENMTDSQGILNPQVDSSMTEPRREVTQEGDNIGKEEVITPAIASTVESLNMLPYESAPVSAAEVNGDLVLELQSTLTDKSNECRETETKLKAAMEEVTDIGRDLEISQKLLDESQMNCAHLENCLHEAREEAHTHRCAADRRASEYSTLRASAVKMRSLFERFRSCVTASGGVANFVESLRALAFSLGNSNNDNEDESITEFRACILVLVEKVGFLSRHRAELLDKCSRAEATHGHLMKELEEKKELVKNLYTKHQLEKQASKEKISFGRFELHELAAFVLNSAGHYEAINRNCSNYYLSAESVALFVEQQLRRKPSYIIGQIVHIERQTVKHVGDHLSSSDTGMTRRLSLGTSFPSNPYSLPIGCEYYVVTVAMLPDTVIHSPQPPLLDPGRA
ncbi:hypothetical protein GIB67_007911 [Kingdonia uniflora]|uniref:Autophagy-related protein 11 n=1 Tax=Kingdonia uniflora TaxID=39325 RepID=A0A7J7PBG7_9MAGN|nr:hypothetical protein GIB67_007911 [Kingdonia uniflora]